MTPSISSVTIDMESLNEWLDSIERPQTLRQGITVLGNWRPLYIIAMTARSGSTMLCTALQGVPELGAPDEYLNDRGPFQFHSRAHPSESLSHYLRSIFTSLPTKAHTLGIKVAFVDFQTMAGNSGITRLVQKANFIYLTRRDVFAQAISLWSANTTNLWHAYDNTAFTPVDGPRDVERVLPVLSKLLAERLQWENFFSLCGIDPFRLVYEDICLKPICTTVRAVAQHIGFDIDPALLDGISTRTTKLSTHTQAEAAERLRLHAHEQSIWPALCAATPHTQTVN